MIDNLKVYKSRFPRRFTKINNFFEVVKNKTGGWDVVDIRTARPEINFSGISVDFQALKKHARLSCNAWNRLDPAPELKIK